MHRSHGIARRLAGVALAGTLAVGCANDGPSRSSAPSVTPEDIVRGIVKPGERVTVEGLVNAVVLNSTPPGDGHGFVRSAERYVLLDATPVAGQSESQAEWGVAAVWSGPMLVSRTWPLPHPGDRLRVTGTVSSSSFGAFVSEARSTLESLEAVEIVSSNVAPLVDVGGACAHDMDCRDDLVCDVGARVCTAPPPDTSWDTDFRGVNGACDADADCALGQYCDTRFRIAADGPYRVHYHVERDAGRHLCQVRDREAPIEDLCPRLYSAEDLLSGRFAEGKEICIAGTVLVSVFSPGDFDTHVQYRLTRPAVWPLALPPVQLFGVAAENVPPYKDPANPAGRIGDPIPDQYTAHLGTVHWDDSHGWYELHAIKMVRLLDPSSPPPGAPLPLARLGSAAPAQSIQAWPAGLGAARGR